MADYTMTDEGVKHHAAQLEDGTLDAIRSGTSVSPEQALAAIAYQSLQPKKKPSRWQQILGRFKRKK